MTALRVPPTWRLQVESLEGGSVQRFRLLDGVSPLSFSEVLRLWRVEPAFGAFFVSVLKESGFSAFRWETPPVTRDTVGRDFEFVLLDSPGLERTPDTVAFSEYFDAAEDVVSFANLGGDAVLITPCPTPIEAAYSHLAAFLRCAPESQVDSLWRTVGITMEQRLSNAPTWLSTAGMGVSWLHVRLDSRPKYYGFVPYVKFP